MTYQPTITKSGPYVSNGAQVDYDFDFKIYAVTDLEVIVTDLLLVESIIDPTDYSIPFSDYGQDDGGTITLDSPYPSGYLITLRLNPIVEQQTNLRNQGPYSPETVERALDRLAMICLSFQEQLSRAVTVAISGDTPPDDYLAAAQTAAAQAIAAAASAVPAAAAAAASANSVNFRWCGVAAGSVNNLTLTPGQALTSYAGANLTFVSSGQNTTATMTANVSGLGTKNIKRIRNGVKSDPLIGEVYGVHVLQYDGTDLLLESPEHNDQLGGFRNKIINGDFRMWDYATSAAIPSTVGYPSANRWAFVMSGAAGIANRDTSVPAGEGFQYSLKLGRNPGSSSTGIIFMSQAFETVDSIPLQGQACFSFWAKAGANLSSAGGAIGVRVIVGTGIDQTVAQMNGGTWTGYAVPIDTSQALTTGWVRYQFTAVIPSSTTQVGVQLYYGPTGTAGADDNIYVTGISLERGYYAKKFEDIGAVVTALRCARFLPVHNGGSTYPIGPGLCYANNFARLNWTYHTPTRVPITGILTTAASGFSAYNSTAGNLTANSIVFYAAGFSGAHIDLGFASTPVSIGFATHGFSNTTAAKILGLGAEL